MTADDVAGATILLVEDDDATRTFLADNLTADGFELLVADCARDARRLLETKYPDLVVLDVGLPDGSGLDLLRAIREADGVASRIDPRVAVLVLSGRGGELDRIRGFDRKLAVGLPVARSPFGSARPGSRQPRALRIARGPQRAGHRAGAG